MVSWLYPSGFKLTPALLMIASIPSGCAFFTSAANDSTEAGSEISSFLGRKVLLQDGLGRSDPDREVI
jgi:hypothetical protein